MISFDTASLYAADLEKALQALPYIERALVIRQKRTGTRFDVTLTPCAPMLMEHLCEVLTQVKTSFGEQGQDFTVLASHYLVTICGVGVGLA